ncbi:MAG: CerR family C-terminal domain-containing protein [Syntrophaceae bacterium]|nr:CerR family C-terminal domain-containing protein [Syntrophaceae bacterium]
MINEKKITAKAESILESAGEIFAQQGFRRTTVREICKRCKVNLAAINYYFGDKEHLYLACLKYYQAIAAKTIPLNFGIKPSDPPQKKLSTYIQTFMFRLLQEDKQTLFGRLLAHEFFEPTGALDSLIEESIKPSFYFLSSLVREVLGNNCPEKEVELCTMSIIGQCFYFRNAQPVIFRLRGKDNYSNDDIKEITDHIINFSLNALKSYSTN